MKSFELAGTKREGLTKQDTKKIRKEGRVPCVIYGGDENIHFSAPVLNFRDLIYTPEAYKVKIDVEGQLKEAIIKEVQFHPVSDKLLHVDFLEIQPDKKLMMDIPIRITGSSEGVKQGGKLVVKARRLKVKGLPTHLPDAVNIDVTPLLIGQSVRIGDLKTEGVEYLDSPNNVIVGIRITRNVVETPAEAAKAAKTATPAAAPATK
jgi:large subunit ribosomal protein L25